MRVGYSIVCPCCSFTYKNRKQLFKHYRKQHSDTTPPSSKPEQTKERIPLGKKHPENQHLKYPEPAVIELSDNCRVCCPICSLTFNARQNLVAHMKKFHFGENHATTTLVMKRVKKAKSSLRLPKLESSQKNKGHVLQPCDVDDEIFEENHIFLSEKVHHEQLDRVGQGDIEEESQKSDDGQDQGEENREEQSEEETQYQEQGRRVRLGKAEGEQPCEAKKQNLLNCDVGESTEVRPHSLKQKKPLSKETSSRGSFDCSECPLKFKCCHYKYAHLDEKGNVTKTKKNKKSYASLAFIKASANGVLHCPKCPMTFKTRSSLGKHFSEVHREDNYECPVCHVIFGTMSTARFHISQLPAYTAMSSFQRRSN